MIVNADNMTRDEALAYLRVFGGTLTWSDRAPTGGYSEHLAFLEGGELVTPHPTEPRGPRVAAPEGVRYRAALRAGEAVETTDGRSGTVDGYDDEREGSTVWPLVNVRGRIAPEEPRTLRRVHNTALSGPGVRAALWLVHEAVPALLALSPDLAPHAEAIRVARPGSRWDALVSAARAAALCQARAVGLPSDYDPIDLVDGLFACPISADERGQHAALYRLYQAALGVATDAALTAAYTGTDVRPAVAALAEARTQGLD